MRHQDTTAAEVLRDPLIRQVMRADGVRVEQLEELLLDAARRLSHLKPWRQRCRQASIRLISPAPAKLQG